jgi:hypothetical protein
LIHQSGYKGFPPRLPEQPIFYPVLKEESATQIVRDWNTKYNAERCGYVTRFKVRVAFLSKYEVHTVGGEQHQEYWIPAEELREFNENKLGEIEVIGEYKADEWRDCLAEAASNKRMQRSAISTFQIACSG